MRIDVVTIFPAYLAPLREALLGRAIAAGLIDVVVHDLRDWTRDVHQAVDDSPYGGGPGMVMRPSVWGQALDEVLGDTALRGSGRDNATPGDDPERRDGPARLIVPTPAGRPFTQATAQAWAAEPRLIFACGRYEGIDQRVVDDYARRMPVDEVSIGDYVLVGGEAAVLVMVEAVVRLLPGVLGNPESAQQDSFSDGLLEGPAYTRPETWRGLTVPPVLRSGNHAAIARWRRDQALERTAARRPDLLAVLPAGALDSADQALLTALGTADNPPRTVRGPAAHAQRMGAEPADEAPLTPRDEPAQRPVSPPSDPSGTMDGLPASGVDEPAHPASSPSDGAAPQHDRDTA